MALLLTDQTANGNNLTNVNAVSDNTASPPFAAAEHYARQTTTSSNYLYAADSASLSITGDTTWEFWMKGVLDPDLLGSRSSVFFTKFGVAGNYSYRFYMYGDGTNMNIWCNWSDDGTSDAGHWTSVKSPNLTATWTNWNHFAIVFTASTHTMEYFINGSSQGTTQSAANVTSIYNGTAKFGIGVGALDGTPAGFWDGYWDEIRIWSDKRTSTEIADNYQIRLTGTEANLVAYWPFETAASPAPAATGGTTRLLTGVGV